MECTNDDLDTMSFLSVSWYKVREQNQVHRHVGCAFVSSTCVFKQLHSGTYQGITRKGKGKSNATFLRADGKAKFGENYSLLLPSVTPEDSGTYECAISAKLGGKNQHFKVNLTVNGMIFFFLLTSIAKEQTDVI